jgi:hypothetical protein
MVWLNGYEGYRKSYIGNLMIPRVLHQLRQLHHFCRDLWKRIHLLGGARTFADLWSISLYFLCNRCNCVTGDLTACNHSVFQLHESYTVTPETVPRATALRRYV